jgi:hypothetical protein
MIALVTNFGQTRSFPTCIGNVYIGATETREIENEKAIEELKAFPMLKVVCKGPSKVPKPGVDWSSFKITQLKSIAVRYKIRGFSRMRRADLIKALEEKHYGQ